jgi:hypothetical protein
MNKPLILLFLFTMLSFATIESSSYTIERMSLSNNGGEGNSTTFATRTYAYSTPAYSIASTNDAYAHIGFFTELNLIPPIPPNPVQSGIGGGLPIGWIPVILFLIIIGVISVDIRRKEIER